MSFNSFDFTDDVCTTLMGNLGTLSSQNGTLNLWTTATANLNTAYLTGSNSKTAQDIWADITAVKTKDMSVADFLSKWMGNQGNFVSDFCQGMISQLLDALSANWNSTTGPTQMSEIQTFGNLVSAQQQKETSTGDTQSKAEASLLQQSTSAQQPISDLGTAAIGILGSISSLLMQSFL